MLLFSEIVNIGVFADSPTQTVDLMFLLVPPLFKVIQNLNI